MGIIPLSSPWEATLVGIYPLILPGRLPWWVYTLYTPLVGTPPGVYASLYTPGRYTSRTSLCTQPAHAPPETPNGLPDVQL